MKNALLALLCTATACSTSKGYETPARSAQQSPIARAMKRHGVPGLAFATLSDCRVKRVEVLGLAHVDLERPVTSDTTFEAASLSKPVLAYLFMRNSRVRDAITLDNPIATHLTLSRIREPDVFSQLTPRILFTHHSGLPNWAGRASDLKRTDPLLFTFSPGARFSYSGEGYQILQSYLETVSGESLEAHFQRELGQTMPSSSFARSVTTPAQGYADDGWNRPVADFPPLAATSLRTVAQDYGRFMGMVCRGEGLPIEVWREMLRPQVELVGDEFGAEPASLDGASLHWTIGWGLQNYRGRTIHFHWGDNGPFVAFAAFDRQSRAGVVFLANSRRGLKLVPDVVEPVVGSMKPVMSWLN